MGARNMWDRVLVYFGIVEDGSDGSARQIEQRSGRDARPARPRRRTATSTIDAEWDAIADEAARPRARMTGPSGVGVVPPRTFNDAQKVADDFKNGVPVIVNLQQTDADLSKRIIDFSSGLTYGLDGTMQRIADRVFLLTPRNVEVSAEDRAALAESAFFNQS